MANPYLVASQVAARRAIDRRWPKRDKGSDGWIADKHHRPPSQHIPDAAGRVRAIDIDRDGIHVPSVVAAMLLNPATWYVIWNRKSMSRKDRFRPRTYTGSNPHTGHIHRSTLLTATADREAAAYPLIVAPARWPLLKLGSKGRAVQELQALLIGHGYGLAIDGDFGPATDRAVRAFQVKHRVRNSVRGGQGDGQVGEHTRAALSGVRS